MKKIRNRFLLVFLLFNTFTVCFINMNHICSFNIRNFNKSPVACATKKTIADLPEALKILVTYYSQFTGLSSAYAFFSPNIPLGTCVTFKVKLKDGTYAVAPLVQKNSETLNRTANFLDNIEYQELHSKSMAVYMTNYFREPDSLSVIFYKTYINRYSQKSAGDNIIYLPVNQYSYAITQ
jgi:hypothetical protein